MPRLPGCTDERMYELSGIGGFTYFPQAAILLVPFALLPPWLGEIAWRLVSVGAFALGSGQLSVLLSASDVGRHFFPLMTLAAVPLVMGLRAQRPGNAADGRPYAPRRWPISPGRGWWLAVLWLCLAVSIKPLAIVLILLVIAVDRAMSWRLVVGLRRDGARAVPDAASLPM